MKNLIILLTLLIPLPVFAQSTIPIEEFFADKTMVSASVCHFTLYNHFSNGFWAHCQLYVDDKGSITWLYYVNDNGEQIPVVAKDADGNNVWLNPRYQNRRRARYENAYMGQRWVAPFYYIKIDRHVFALLSMPVRKEYHHQKAEAHVFRIRPVIFPILSLRKKEIPGRQE